MAMSGTETTPLDVLRRFAPGTTLRDAVDLILRQGTGALMLFGSPADVEPVCSGGFVLKDTPFSAQRVAELAKMDGGIVVSADASHIERANVHFVPDSSIATEETGTRFRTAERLARQTGCPVLSISEEGRSTAIVFHDSDRYELRRPTDLYAQANQTLNSIERLRRRLQEAEDRLTRLEVDDVVTVRDVAMLIQRAALVRRLFAEVERLVVELGGEAHLISIQATDLMDGVDELAQLVFDDYVRRRARTRLTVFDRLSGVATDQLYQPGAVAAALKFDALDASTRPRGVRALAGVPRLPETVKEALIGHFKDFQKLLKASVDDLDLVEGVGTARAHQLRSYLDRLRQVGTIGN
jgi:diadenylate cyclase